MNFNYYNRTNRILLWIFCLLPFLSMGILFFVLGNSLTVFLGTVLLVLLLVFFYKCTFIRVMINKEGITYKSLFYYKYISWSEVKDILIVVRQRRSAPDYYKYKDWIQAGYESKNYFLLFRTSEKFPVNPMFMFSAPIGENYISIQYRKKIGLLLKEIGI